MIDERKTHELLANLTALRKKSHPVMKKRGPAQNYVSIGSYPDPVASKLESNLQTIPYEYNSSAKREDLNKL